MFYLFLFALILNEQRFKRQKLRIKRDSIKSLDDQTLEQQTRDKNIED